MLEIKNLHVRAANNDILRGINLTVQTGEVHAIMGPNGSGKSTLARVLAGHPDYQVMEGSVTYDGKDLLELAPEDRARKACSWRSSTPSKSPASTIVLPEGGGQRQEKAPRTGRTRRDGIHGVGERESKILHLDPSC